MLALQRDPHILKRRQMRKHRRNLKRAHQAEPRHVGRRKRGDVAPVVADLTAVGCRNLVSRLKHVVLPAPLGPISAWMVPRRTRRSTSRTAMKPANSLVNPWVSRMNSSANQYSLLSFRSVSPARLSFVAARPVRMRLDIISDPVAFPKNMPSMDRVRQGAKRHPAGVGGRIPSAISRKTDDLNSPAFRRPAPPIRAIVDRNLVHQSASSHARRIRDVIEPIEAVLSLLRCAKLFFVNLWLEADQQLAASLQHRPLDHRGLRQHQRQRLRFIQTRLVRIGQFAERRAGAVQQCFPTEFCGPSLEPGAIDADGLVIVKVIGDAMARPATRAPSSWCRSS